MKNKLIFCYILFYPLFAYAQDSIELSYATELGDNKITVLNSITKLEIYNSTNPGSPKMIKDISGLDALPQLETVELIWFPFVAVNSISTNQPLHLIIKGSDIIDVNIYFRLPIKALSFKGCKFPKDICLVLGDKKIDYLEISNSGLTSIPSLKGSVSIVNYSFNYIDEIKPYAINQYSDCDRVILLRNKVTKSIANFIVNGKLKELIPEEYYLPE